MRQSLEGIKVLDLTRVLAGPYATMILADLGADVMKVEMPVIGDDSRHFGPYVGEESAYFMSLNRNKRSMTLNLKNETARELLLDMVRNVDIVVENFRPGTMEKLGIGYDTLKEINPKLIYAAASGFGHTGPYSKRPAYDAIVQAMGGIMSITGPAGGPFTRVGSSMGDIIAGLFAAIGILAAVRYRDETGIGQMVDVAMLDTQLAILENAMARYTVTGEIPGPEGNRHPSITPFEPFKTKDGELMVAVGNDAIWKRFCPVIGLEELKDDERFLTNPLRNKHYEQLRPQIAEAMLQRTTEEWIELFNENSVPNGPINTVDKVLENPQIIAREMVQVIEHPVAGKLKVPGVPIKMSETQGEVRTPAPTLGQHTDQILKDLLQLTDEEIQALKDKGIF